jgi:argininosuccinate lyase
VIHGGEEYMRKHCDEENSGWLHLGRSSPSIRTVATRIAFRRLQMQIMDSINELRGTLADSCTQNREITRTAGASNRRAAPASAYEKRSAIPLPLGFVVREVCV